MSEKHEITCDTCGKDLTTTGYEAEYRLVVKSEPLAWWGGAVFSMSLPPPVERALHFCGLRCLRESDFVASLSKEEGGVRAPSAPDHFPVGDASSSESEARA